MAHQREGHENSAAPLAPPPRASAWLLWWPELLIFGVSIAVYLNALGNGFVYDARVLIEENAAFQRSTEWLAWFSRPYWWGFGERSNLYRPLTILSFVFNYRLTGLTPFWFHLTDVLLHGGVSVLVLALGRRLLGMPAALVGAFLFAVHPLHTEVVAWIAGRAELLSALFALLACLAFLRATDPLEVKPWVWIAIAVSGYFLSLLSKEHAAPLPAWWALAWWLGRPRARLHRIAPAFLGAVGALALYGLLRQNAIHVYLASLPGFHHAHDIISSPLMGAPLWQRWLTAAAVLTRYAWLWLWPASLSVDYSYAQILPSPGLGPLELLGFLLLIGWGLTILLTARPAPGLALTLALVPTTFLVASNFLFLVGALLSERYFYLATIGLSLVSGWLLTRAAQSLAKALRWKTPQWLLPGLLTLLLLALAARTVLRNPDWQSDYTIFRAALAVSPKSANVLAILGREEMHRGNSQAARPLLEEAARLTPKYEKARILLGLAYANLGEIDKALEEYRQASVLSPESPAGFHNAGVLLWKQGRLVDAEAAYREALRRQPQYLPSRIDLGWLLQAQRKPTEAMEQFRAVLRLVPRHPEALYGAAVASAALGDLGAARRLGRLAQEADYPVPEQFWRALGQGR